MLKEQQDENNAVTVSERISSLIYYSHIHFATEEQYLVQTTFPDLKTHVLAHVDFIMKTLELSVKNKKGTKVSRLELLRYLKG